MDGLCFALSAVSVWEASAPACSRGGCRWDALRPAPEIAAYHEGVRAERFGPRLCRDGTVEEEDRSGAHAQGLLHMVIREEDGHPVLGREGPEHVSEAARLLRVDPCERLVADEDL